MTGPIDENRVITLMDNVHPMAKSEFDQGALAPDTVLSRMMLQLNPSARQQAELDALVEEQHDPASPLYHKWLTPAQYGARFGASAEDVARVTTWLKSHGFRIDEIAASNRLITFSGTAAEVADTFHTEVRHYQVNGATHIANAQDPQIPAAFGGVIGGIVTLHDFRRESAITSRKQLGTQASAELRPGEGARPQYSYSGGNILFPSDLATIYDLNSLYAAGTSGTRASISIVGRSNINLSDVTQFRSASALSANPPHVILVSTDPGLVSGDQDESTLDVEWSGGMAPGATVNFVVGNSTNTSDGVDLSAQYIVNHALGQIISTSYGSCEQSMGATELSFYNSLWQQAATQGMSSFVSSGDSGAAGCYGGGSNSGSGAGVNGLCSSPYSTCVGGTEFNEGSKTSQYWSATNGTGLESALSYIPEVVWNESGSNGGSGLWASTGGVSLVYLQPSWQRGVSGTSPANGMRAVPDVALDAASHDGYTIVENGQYYIIAGTSAASPSFAGIMALVVQSRGGVGQGNANTSLYPLVNATHNPFHPTPSGNNSVPGVTGFSANGGTYNLATGLGSVDGALLVSGWAAGGTPAGPDFTLRSSATSGTALAGKAVTFTLSAVATGAAKNSIALRSSAPAGVTVTINPTSILPGATATVTIAPGLNATAGAQSINITGSDSSGSQSVAFALTVTPAPTLTLTANSASLVLLQGARGTVGLTAATGGSYSGAISFTVSALPAGVTATWSANPLTPSASISSNQETLTLSASSTAAVTTANVVVTAAGDGLAVTQTVALQVQRPASMQLSASPASISMQSLSTSVAIIQASPVGGAVIPAGAAGSSISVVSGLPRGITASWSAPSVNAAGTAAWTLTLTGSATAVAGNSTLGLSARIAAKSGTIYTVTQNVPITVTLTPPVLTVTSASSSLTLAQGATVTDVVTLAGNGTYSGPVSLAVSGLPAGVTASWTSSPVTLVSEAGSARLTLAASSAAAVGSATITISAKGDGLIVTKSLSLQVQYAPGIQLAVSPSSVSTQSLSSTTVTITATPVGGLVIPATAAGSTISVASGLPRGFTAAWSAPSVGASGAVTWRLSLAGSSAAVAGSSTLAVTARVLGKTGGTYAMTQNLPLAVTLTPPTLTISPAATSSSLAQGRTGTLAVTVKANGTFTGSVSLSVTGLPSGVTASWRGNPLILSSASGTSTLTLTAASAAKVGVATVTLVASGDGVTSTSKVSVQILQAPALKAVLPSTRCLWCAPSREQ